MSTKVQKCGIKKEKGWLYYLDKKGNVARAKMVRRGAKTRKAPPETVVKCGVHRENGFLYFIDKQGDVAKAKMARR